MVAPAGNGNSSTKGQAESQAVVGRIGESVILGCDLLNAHEARPPLYVIEWVRFGFVLPIFIKFGLYSPRVDPEYVGKSAPAQRANRGTGQEGGWSCGDGAKGAGKLLASCSSGGHGSPSCTRPRGVFSHSLWSQHAGAGLDLRAPGSGRSWPGWLWCSTLTHWCLLRGLLPSPWLGPSQGLLLSDSINHASLPWGGVEPHG